MTHGTHAMRRQWAINVGKKVTSIMKYMLYWSCLSKRACLNLIHCMNLSLVAIQVHNLNLSPLSACYSRHQIKVSHHANHKLHGLWTIHAQF